MFYGSSHADREGHDGTGRGARRVGATRGTLGPIRIDPTRGQRQYHGTEKTEDVMVAKEEIDSDGEVRYYGGVQSIADVVQLYTADELASLRIVSIRDAKLADTAGIGAFANVERLAVANHAITSVQELEALGKLEDLDLSDNRLTSVTGIADLPLKQLDLSNNPIVSLTEIEAPKTLQTLRINGAKIGSLAGLPRFTELRSLELSGNSLESLAFDGTAPSIRSLNVRQGPMKTTAGLEAFPNLEVLSIGDEIRLVEGLERCAKLERIELHGPVEEITEASLEVLVALKKRGGKVKIYGTDDVFIRFPQLKLPPKEEPRRGGLSYRGEPMTIKGLAGLYSAEELGEVDSLTLTSCYLTDTDGLDAFTAVTALDLGRNSISSVSGLAALPNLESADLEQNKLVSVADIEPSATLETLSLSRNELESLRGLEGFAKLRVLDVSRNPSLKSAECGGAVPSLEEITFYQCGLESLEGLAQTFPNLKKLAVKENGLKHIAGLEGFEHLEQIELGEDVETLDAASVEKIVQMRQAGHRVMFGYSSAAPARLLEAYPALAAE